MSTNVLTAAVDVPRIAVMQVNSTLHIGGAERVAASIAGNLDRRRFDARACYLKEPGVVADEMRASGVDISPIPGLIPGRRDLLTSLKLRRQILEQRIQIIHTHDLHGLIDGSVCRMLMPHLRHVHTLHYGNYANRARRQRRIERTLWRVPDALVAVGLNQAAEIRGLYGIPERRLRIIWNGVGEARVATPNQVPFGAFPPGVPVIASISTLIRQKGLEHLLNAAALLRDKGESFLLLVAGDGPLRGDLVAQVRRLALEDHVRFLGWIPDAPQHLLPVCDIFVQSSLWEAMSIVVLEAMAAARPVVVTAVGENPHVLIDGGTGLLVPPADPALLAAKLQLLLRDPQLRARLGDSARIHYLQRFTVRHMVGAYEQLYCQLAGVRIPQQSSRNRAS